MEKSSKNLNPTEYVATLLLHELYGLFEKKLSQIVNDDQLDKSINKLFKRGEDVYFDNLLRVLSNICNSCICLILSELIQWYSSQQKVSLSESGKQRDQSVKKTLGACYLFCLTLIEILSNVNTYPAECEEQILFLIKNAFGQITYRDPLFFGHNYNNSLIIAEIFSEVIGVLSQSHPSIVQQSFFSYLNEMRCENPLTPSSIRNIVSLFMGMKFYRVKISQIKDFEMGISFLNELGSYYLEIDLKQKDLKHALAGLLVEILSPISAQIKTEANIPFLISFVDKLYSPTYDLVNKKQHKMAVYPLLTCLLCISQSKFFLLNWVPFLNLTLANLKNKDTKMSRIALESLYRLLWVYIIRNNCEGNTATRSRLESICGSLFPRGNRNVVPRDAPLNIFVKMIHFIAQKKLDFAFKEIIFDLLGCNRASRAISIYPERMNIGIRALMVIADSLQQKNGPPAMPYSLAPIVSGTIQRTKKIFITRPLTMKVANQLGLGQYYQPCRKVFDNIIRALDMQVGRPLMLTSYQVRGKEFDEIKSGDLKAKLDLFRTCIAAIPRLSPNDSLTPDSYILEMLVRMCIHVNEELRKTAYHTLQNLVVECPTWRSEIILIFVRFSTNTIPDVYTNLLESTQWFILQLLNTWKCVIINEQKLNKKSLIGESEQFENKKIFTKKEIYEDTSFFQSSLLPQSTFEENKNTELNYNFETNQDEIENVKQNSVEYVMHCTEGYSLTMLCQTNSQIRQNAILILNEAKQILNLSFSSSNTIEKPMIDVLNEATFYVLNKYIVHISNLEKQTWDKDFATACEKICNLEVNDSLVNNEQGNEYMRWDPWACALSGFCEHQFLLSQCQTAVDFAWPALFNKLNICTQFVDPSNPQNESRGSLLRTSKGKSNTLNFCKESLSQENYLSLWQKYLVVCCSLAKTNSNYDNGLTSIPNTSRTNAFLLNRSFSPNMSSDFDGIRNLSNIVPYQSINSTITNGAALVNNFGNFSITSSFTQLIEKIIHMIRWDNMTDIKDSVVLGIGSINSFCFENLLDELNVRGIFRELHEKKLENNSRRRKRKNLLRIQVLRIIEMIIFRRAFEVSDFLDHNNGKLSPLFLDFLESLKTTIDINNSIDNSSTITLKLHFAKFVSLIIQTTPYEKRNQLLSAEFSYSLFTLFLPWCSRVLGNDRRREVGVNIEKFSLQALCALSCCGSIFEMYKKITNDDEFLFRWIETMLISTHDIKCEETLYLMLHFNEHYPKLLERIIRICYTEGESVAYKSFKALAMLFTQRDYPCEFVSLFVLCQTFAENLNTTISKTALLLLQIIRQNFLDDSLSRCISTQLVLPIEQKIESYDKIKQYTFFHHKNQNKFYYNSSSEKLFLRIKNKSNENFFNLTQDFKEENQIKLIKKNLKFSSEAAIFELSKLFVHLTMPVFSEVCSLIEKARENRQSSMLSLLYHWIENIELVDSNCCVCEANESKIDNSTLLKKNVFGCIVSGSEEGTQLVLNNLFYLTFKYGNIHNLQIKNLWISLATNFSKNLSIIIHYLYVVISLGSFTILTIAKKICSYLLSSPNCSIRLINILMEELQNTEEPFKSKLIRSDIEPFYRWSSLFDIEKNKKCHFFDKMNDQATTTPKQLPMPPYGGYYSKLSTILPSISQTVSIFSRNNLAIFLLSDLFGTESNNVIDWHLYIAKALHIAILCLDENNLSVRLHSRKIIINILLLYSKALNIASFFHAALTLLNNELKPTNDELLEKSYKKSLQDFAEVLVYNNTLNYEFNFDKNVDNNTLCAKFNKMLFVSDDTFNSSTELLVSLIYMMSNKPDQFLWNCEDVQLKEWKLESNKSLACFVRHVAEYFSEIDLHFAKNWTIFAVNLALNTTKKHFAGRSFQIAAALCQIPHLNLFNQLLLQLIKIIDDGNEETQCYLIELVFCIESFLKNIFQSIKKNKCFFDNFTTSSKIYEKNLRHSTLDLLHEIDKKNLMEYFWRKGLFKVGVSQSDSKKKKRYSLFVENDLCRSNNFNEKPIASNLLIRSKSATILKTESNLENFYAAQFADAMKMLQNVLNIAIVMLESSIENEFLLSLHLLNMIFATTRNFDLMKTLDEAGKTINYLKWSIGYRGIVDLVSRGAVFSGISNQYVKILSHCINFLNYSIIAGKNFNEDLNNSVENISNAFVKIVVSILPHCMLCFENPTVECSFAAKTISKYCFKYEKLSECYLSKTIEKKEFNDSPFTHLSTIMDQYQNCNFPRDCLQWAKCVINYLSDAFYFNISDILTCLLTMLEFGVPQIKLNVLNVINFLINCSKFIEYPTSTLNVETVRIVLKYFKQTNNQNVSNVLKNIIERWSNTNSCPNLIIQDFDQNKVCCKKDKEKEIYQNEKTLKERLIQLCTLYGISLKITKQVGYEIKDTVEDCSNSINNLFVTEFNKINLNSQSNNFNSACNLDNKLKKNTSTDFQFSSLNLDDSTYMNEKSVEIASIKTNSFPRVFKEFDFLEAENDSISESTDSCFNWLSTMRSPRTLCNENEFDGEDGGDDHDDDFSPIEDDGDENELIETNNQTATRSFVQEENNEYFLTNKATNLNDRTPFNKTKSQFKQNLLNDENNKNVISCKYDESDNSLDYTPTQTPLNSEHEYVTKEKNECATENLALYVTNTPNFSITHKQFFLNNLKKNQLQMPYSNEQHEMCEKVFDQKNNNENVNFVVKSSLFIMRQKKFSKNKWRRKNTKHKNFQIKKKKKLLENLSDVEINIPNVNNALSNSTSIQSFQSTSAKTINSDLASFNHKTLLKTSSNNMSNLSAFHVLKEKNVQLNDSTENCANLKQHVKSVLIECNQHVSEQNHFLWFQLLNESNKETEDSATSTAIILFVQLLRESCFKTATLLQDMSNLLTIQNSQLVKSSYSLIGQFFYNSQQFASSSTQNTVFNFELSNNYFLEALNIVMAIAECPFLYVSIKFLRSANVCQMIKLMLYELREHFETFSERRAQCIRLINTLRSFMKLFTILSSSEIETTSYRQTSLLANYKKQEIELCKCCYKLLFQLNLMTEKFIEMVFKISQTDGAQDTDLSSTVSIIQRDLLKHLSIDFTLFLNIQSCNFLTEKHFDSLILHLTNKQYNSVFATLRLLRCQYGSVYGCCEQTDIETILIHYCQSHNALKTWAIIAGGFENVTKVKNNCIILREINLKIMNFLNIVNQNTFKNDDFSPTSSILSCMGTMSNRL